MRLLIALGALAAIVSALALVCFLSLGCDLLNGSGSDASCDGGQLLGAQCTEVYQALCNQGARCGIPTGSDCVTTAAMHCPCSVENCDASSCETLSLKAQCEQDLTMEDCNAIVNYETAGYWPMDCQPFMGQQ